MRIQNNKMNKTNNILLTNWLNNTMSEKELKQFQASEDYNLLTRIMSSSQKLQAPFYDVDAAYQKTIAKKNAPKSKKWWQYSVAASVILLIGFFISYTTFFSETTYSSNFGEQLTFNLPDGSKVTLNAKSTLTFNTHNWNTNRNLQLKGEAFFDVKKGKTFTVNTQQGTVRVLGTEFNVKAQPDFFKVTCFEGKVEVLDVITKVKRYLTPNNGYQNIDTQITLLYFNTNNPKWLQQISIFKSVPFKHVFKSLEKQYNITLEYQNFNDNLLFTGSFPNNNKKVALQTVLKSAKLQYKIQENRVILQK